MFSCFILKLNDFGKDTKKFGEVDGSWKIGAGSLHNEE